MRLVYEKEIPAKEYGRRNKTIYVFTGCAVTICAVCGFLLYSSFHKPQVITPETKDMQYLAAPSETVMVDIQNQDSIMQVEDFQKASAYINIEGAHDFTNFEYLIKEIGDNTNPE